MLKAAAAGAVCGVAAPALALGDRREKPNLLFLWTDEQRADTMAAYGNRRIHAPNLNKLAAESVVFRNAYVAQPVCTPDRSTVMTGLWPHTSGCTTNNVPLPDDVPCLNEILGDILGDADYRAGYMGKWHLGDEIFAQHGFQEWVSIEDTYIGHYGRGRDRAARSSYHHFLLDKGYRPNQKNIFTRDFAARRPLEHCKPKFLEQEACKFLRRHRDQPFILYVNFLEPHMPFFGPLNDEHDPSRIDLPPNFDDPLEENEPLRYRLLRESYRTQYPDEAAWRRLIARYWGLVTQVDLSVGAILGTLADLGLEENTIVVYTSDHGDMMGSHKMVAKSVMYEESARIPWLMRIPQRGTPRKLIDDPVSHIDLVPTLLDLMGAERDERLAGHSLLPRIRGEALAEDHVFIQWNPGAGFRAPKKVDFATKEEIDRVARESTRTVVSPDRWKLCLSDLDKPQLFNLTDDPYETTNLVDRNEHRGVVRRLTARIHKWQASVDDSVEV
jgi:arylsulfatase A-like enzyme